jgi:hypothetical protein
VHDSAFSGGGDTTTRHHPDQWKDIRAKRLFNSDLLHCDERFRREMFPCGQRDRRGLDILRRSLKAALDERASLKTR